MRGSARGAVAEQPSSRRSLLLATGATFAAGSAALLAACSTKAPKKAPAAAPGARPGALRHDVVILNAALDVEHKAIAAYTAGIPLLSGAALAAAKQFLAQEFSHAAELSSLIHDGGGKPSPVAPTYDLGNPQSDTEVLALLHGIEDTMIATYLALIPRLNARGARSTVAAMLANEAEHVAVLRTSLGRPAVPSAFVTATE